MPLPEVYGLQAIRDGKRQPDYGAVDAALPDDLFLEDRDPEIVDLRTLGDRLLAVSEALPKIGKQGTFAYIYGTLTHSFADKLDGRSTVSHLPDIQHPDEFIPQANRFSWSYLRPVGRYNHQAATGRVAVAPMLRMVVSRDRHWIYSLDSSDIQFGEPPVQFVGDMGNHIFTDLGLDLYHSKVSAAYMQPGGDYDNTNQFIRHVTMAKAGELVPGPRPLVRAVAQPVHLAIAGMRRVARSNYNELRCAGSQAEFDSIQAGAVADGVRVSRLTARYGNTAIRAFALMAGAKTLVDKRKEISERRQSE